uniref:Uncharacterized protein n=2 Tax=Anguilla anguilla TaxID=7936 RepID=A0A0E9QRN5_ANGAN
MLQVTFPTIEMYTSTMEGKQWRNLKISLASGDNKSFLVQ